MVCLAIDFGTSNCTACVADGKGNIVQIALEGDALLLPSVIFSTRQLTDLADSSRLEREQILFGTQALHAYFNDPTGGTLIRSPKSFLGSTIDARAQAYFGTAIQNILGHIKKQAESQVGVAVSRVILGRPVNFQGSQIHDGNGQALSIMIQAAQELGFTDIQFLMEPVAAALEFESTLVEETTVLIVDIGGGTTDCAILKASPARHLEFNREADIVAQTGDRIGGTDFDQALALKLYLPLLGKDEINLKNQPIPQRIHMDAIATRDVPAQSRFIKSEDKIKTLMTEVANPTLLKRLLFVQQNKLQHRLINCAETAKIELSGTATHTTSLEFIEKNLLKDLTRQDFCESTERQIAKICSIVRETIDQSDTKPEAVFLTGGMSNSPVVRDRIAQMLDAGVKIQSGDSLCSVGRGLGIYADRYVSNTEREAKKS